MNDFFKFTTEAIGTESKRLRGARHVKADRIGSCNHVLNNVSSCTRVNLKSSWIYELYTILCAIVGENVNTMLFFNNEFRESQCQEDSELST